MTRVLTNAVLIIRLLHQHPEHPTNSQGMRGFNPIKPIFSGWLKKLPWLGGCLWYQLVKWCCLSICHIKRFFTTNWGWRLGICHDRHSPSQLDENSCHIRHLHMKVSNCIADFDKFGWIFNDAVTWCDLPATRLRGFGVISYAGRKHPIIEILDFLLRRSISHCMPEHPVGLAARHFGTRGVGATRGLLYPPWS